MPLGAESSSPGPAPFGSSLARFIRCIRTPSPDTEANPTHTIAPKYHLSHRRMIHPSHIQEHHSFQPATVSTVFCQKLCQPEESAKSTTARRLKRPEQSHTISYHCTSWHITARCCTFTAHHCTFTALHCTFTAPRCTFTAFMPLPLQWYVQHFKSQVI